MPFDVEDRLSQAPTGEAGQAGGKGLQKIAAQRLLKQKLQGVADALRVPPETAGGKERETADDQKDDAARGITDPHHPGDRPGCQKREKFGCVLIHEIQGMKAAQVPSHEFHHRHGSDFKAIFGI